MSSTSVGSRPSARNASTRYSISSSARASPRSPLASRRASAPRSRTATPTGPPHGREATPPGDVRRLGAPRRGSPEAGGHQDELTRRGLGGLRRPVAEQFLEDLALRVVERPLHVREMEELCLQALHF